MIKKKRNEIFEPTPIKPSILTELWDNPHLRAVHHVCLIIFLVALVNTALNAYFKNEEIDLGQKLIAISFVNYHLFALGWIILLSLACIAYYCFRIWSRFRISTPKNGKMQKWDKFWLSMLLIYFGICAFLPQYFIGKFDLFPVLSFSLLVEQARLLMKFYSFVRENSGKVINHKPHSDEDLVLPTFSHYFYFLFAPTIIYKDRYGRYAKIRWSFVLFYFIQLIVVTWCFAFVCENFFLPSVRYSGCPHYTVGRILLILSNNVIVIGFLMFLLNFIILHSVQNLFAELLTFSDRNFFSGWWTVVNYADFFRKWNHPVGNWLYVYIYKDSRDVLGFSSNLSKVAVFMVSNIVHEWIIISILGCFVPFLSVLFSNGIALSFVRLPESVGLNILFIYLLAYGGTCLSTLTGFEYYARTTIPVQNPGFSDWFQPRFWTCE